MQDVQTGRMEALTENQHDLIQKMNEELTKRQHDLIQKANEVHTKKPITKKIPVFKVGEVVEVKGGRFRVLKLTPSGMILKGVPIHTPLGIK